MPESVYALISTQRLNQHTLLLIVQCYNALISTQRPEKNILCFRGDAVVTTVFLLRFVVSFAQALHDKYQYLSA